MKAWVAANPARSGRANFSREAPVRSFSAYSTGIKMIKATSKNTGIAIRKPVSAIAAGARSTPCLRMRYCAMACAPPAFSNKAPNIAPSPTTVATKPRVPPMPFCMASITAGPSSPLPKPAAMAAISKARKAGMRHFRMSSKRSKMLSTVASTGIGQWCFSLFQSWKNASVLLIKLKLPHVLHHFFPAPPFIMRAPEVHGEHVPVVPQQQPKRHQENLQH